MKTKSSFALQQRLCGLSVITVVCILSLIICAGMSRHPGNKAGDSDVNELPVEGGGPTVVLDYDEKTSKNPVASFMYFVPLISPVSIYKETSADSNQQGGIISYERTVNSKSFYAACGFNMEGRGFQKYIFDPAEMIARNTGDLKEGEPLTNILGWIKFEGEGEGLFEVKGTIDGSRKTVTEVTVNFNEGSQSPVTVGLYSVKPQDGQYKYENKYNEIVARINALTFKKSESEPRMAIKISTIRKKTEEESFGGDFEAFIANFFIKPLEVDELGNDAMLSLGKAIADKKNTFVFPKAHNIKEDKVVTAETE